MQTDFESTSRILSFPATLALSTLAAYAAALPLAPANPDSPTAAVLLGQIDRQGSTDLRADTALSLIHI